MLMRIREQKGWIRGIFIALILVFASSFVIGGVGSGSNFSLSDIIGGGSGGSSSSTDTGNAGALLKQVKAHPNNAALWTQLSEAYSTNNQTLLAVQAAEHATKLQPEQRRGPEDACRSLPAQANVLTSQAQNLYTEAYNLQQQDPGSSPFQAIARRARRRSRSATPGPVQSGSEQPDLGADQPARIAVERRSPRRRRPYNSKALAQYHTDREQARGRRAELAPATRRRPSRSATTTPRCRGTRRSCGSCPTIRSRRRSRTKVKSIEKTIAAAKTKAATATTTTTTTGG